MRSFAFTSILTVTVAATIVDDLSLLQMEAVLISRPKLSTSLHLKYDVRMARDLEDGNIRRIDKGTRYEENHSTSTACSLGPNCMSCTSSSNCLACNDGYGRYYLYPGFYCKTCESGIAAHGWDCKTTGFGTDVSDGCCVATTTSTTWPSSANALANECADAACFMRAVNYPDCDYLKSQGYCEMAKAVLGGARMYVNVSIRIAQTLCRATCGLCEVGQEKAVVNGRRFRSRLDGKCVQYDDGLLRMAQCDSRPGQLWSTSNAGPLIGAQYFHLASDSDKRAQEQRVLTFNRSDADKHADCGEEGDVGCGTSMNRNKESCVQQWFFVQEQLRSNIQKGYGNQAELWFSHPGLDDCLQAMEDGHLRFRQCRQDDDSQRFYFE